MRLRDKVAIVTGAGRGIGRAVATRFAAEGAEVVIAEINPHTGHDVADSIQSCGGGWRGSSSVTCQITARY